MSGATRTSSPPPAHINIVDVLLLDMNLPDLHGLELVQQLHAADHPVDIIAITAARELATVRQAIAAGVVQYLIKPFAFSAFAEKMEAYRAYRIQSSRAADAPEASAVDQKAVDMALASLQGGTAPRQQPEPHLPLLPKGLSEQTLRSVIRWLRSVPAPVSAQEVTDALGISRVTARRYLEYLADHGPVRSSPRYGSPGRPEHEYSWRASASSPSAPPQRGNQPPVDQA
ncbi:response regulator [Acaricomes phytoseiuli]|uniref:response regulator n=1 Tax=Acaricomes phytoseiuli TaxID=291968 RepID=UPI000361299E